MKEKYLICVVRGNIWNDRARTYHKYAILHDVTRFTRGIACANVALDDAVEKCIIFYIFIKVASSGFVRARFSIPYGRKYMRRKSAIFSQILLARRVVHSRTRNWNYKEETYEWKLTTSITVAMWLAKHKKLDGHQTKNTRIKLYY